jgi:FkbM family methyltransferase
MDQLIRFIHIPKTAGTSLREEFLSVFGNRAIQDYDNIRSPIIRGIPSNSKGLLEVLEAHNTRVFMSHAPYAQQADIFAPENTIVFVRDPIDRLLSQYHFLVRSGMLDGPLLAYAQIGQIANLQTHCTNGLPLEKAFVGITEHYEESLRGINARFGLTLKHRVSNRNPNKQINVPYQISPEERERLEQICKDDITLYSQLLTIFISDNLVSGKGNDEPRFARKWTNDAAIFRSVAVNHEYGTLSFTGKKVLDIGAHIGSFSILAVRSGATLVHAYEPNPENFRLLQMNCEGLPVVLSRMAVWRSDEQVPALGLARSADMTNTGGGGVGQLVHHPEPVSAVGLDTILKQQSFDIMKLDCEAAEYPILFTSKLFSHVPVIVGEFHPHVYPAPEDLFHRLRQTGYTVQVLNTASGFGKFWARKSNDQSIVVE